MANETITNARQFRFELVAPEKVELSGLEESVMLPGEMGSFTVLAGHTPLLAGLRPGLVSVIRSGNASQHFYISGGFVDIGNTHCIVMTPHVTPVEKLVAADVEKEIAELTAKRNTMGEKEAFEAATLVLEGLMIKRDAAVKYGS